MHPPVPGQPRETLLLVEDDPGVSKALKTYLTREGYAVGVAETVAAMRATIASQPVGLVILDINLPDEDGWSALRWLRARDDTPVIMLTARQDTVDKIIGLELGADDYLAKPFEPRELLARIRTVQRRSRRDPATAKPVDSRIAVAEWVLDCDSQQLIAGDGNILHLTAAEYTILHRMVTNPGRVVTRDELAMTLTGRNWDPSDRGIDVHVSRLRRKLDPDPEGPSLIRSVRGAGYMFVPGRG